MPYYPPITLFGTSENSTTAAERTLAVATASLPGLILKTTDNSRNNWILDWRNSASETLGYIDTRGVRVVKNLPTPAIEGDNFLVGLVGDEEEGSVGFYMQNRDATGYAEMLFVGSGGEFEDVMSAGIGGNASADPYTNRGYFYTADNLDGLLFQAGAVGATIRFDAGGFDNEVFRLDDSAVAGDTRMLVYDVDNGQMERVSVGAPNSGGSGFKLLRIPN